MARYWLFLFTVLALTPRVGDADSDFYAYYTRVSSGEAFEQYDRTGEYADIAVSIGSQKGKLIFWRGSGYLPYWETGQNRWFVTERVSRKGDGDTRRPDRVNAFSYVSLVENTPEKVAVLWRYLPQFEGGNPPSGLNPTRFVEELFEVTPDGKVTRTVRQGTPRYDDWIDPANRYTQIMQLSQQGIQEIETVEPHTSIQEEPIQGRPLRKHPNTNPAREWTFDEGKGDSTAESVSGSACAVAGHKSLWRKGVSGTALQFDGYNTVISLPADPAFTAAPGLTLEGWAAVGAYPWNWAPLVQQGDDEGFFLGVDGHGHPGFKIQVNGRWEELVSARHLERSRWYYLAGTYDAASGRMVLYIDGKGTDQKEIEPGPVQTVSEPIQIGKGMPRRPVDPVRDSTFIASYSFDGQIDEVSIFGTPLTPEQIEKTYLAYRPADEAAEPPDMEYRLLPKFDTKGRFGAYTTHLKFYESWDVLWRFGDHPDVVVGFDKTPARFVFWRGMGYIPALVNDRDQWYSNEFNETWNRTGGQGCMEPMSDKEIYTNHVRVLENTPARVVVQWRFPLKDVLHVYANWHEDTGWADWSDWYYTVYPDGVAVKRMHLWTDGPRNHEWQESMAILGPNQHPEQVIETEPALILAGFDGQATTYNWSNGPPKQVNYENQKIHVVNYKSEYDPFTIGDFLRGDVYGGEQTPYSVFPSWNHWPVAQIPSDGRYASFPDRTAHSSLTHVFLPDFDSKEGDRPYQEKVMLEGMSNRPVSELAVLAKSWLRAPEVLEVQNAGSGGYDQAERAYLFMAQGEFLSFRIDASPERPLYNPCFVIRNWNTDGAASCIVNDRVLSPGASFRQGIVRDTQGRRMMVIWLELQATEPTRFAIRGTNP